MLIYPKGSEESKKFQEFAKAMREEQQKDFHIQRNHLRGWVSKKLQTPEKVAAKIALQHLFRYILEAYEGEILSAEKADLLRDFRIDAISLLAGDFGILYSYPLWGTLCSNRGNHSAQFGITFFALHLKNIAGCAINNPYLRELVVSQYKKFIKTDKEKNMLDNFILDIVRSYPDEVTE